MNDLGQRTNVEQSGTAFSSARDIAWNYDLLGQVTGADSSIPAHNRSYQYDTIGNRLQSGAGVSPAAITSYTANSLNQYLAISGGGFQPPSPTYDLDGNQIDAQILPSGSPSLQSCVFSWDAENRLIAVKDASNNVLVSYHYDAQFRRISRSVGVSPTSSTLYLYDGWNCIAEYQQDGSGHALKRSYLWGMDLSGSMQGAGGVGGLLAISEISSLTSEIYYPTFDGNGNVSEYLDSVGVIKAHFEYDPFGKTLPTMPLASENLTLKETLNYRFSTKPVDSATGLLYYGYRWYDSLTGRWPSRDPIEEGGGLNFYNFAGNDGVNRIDLFGLSADSMVIKGAFQWWHSRKGPSGGGDSQKNIGHADPYLFTISARVEAWCCKGKPELRIIENGSESQSYWWGHASGKAVADFGSSGTSGNSLTFTFDSEATTSSTLVHGAAESVGGSLAGAQLPGGAGRLGGAGWGAAVGAMTGALHNWLVEGTGKIKIFVTVECADSNDPKKVRPKGFNYNMSEQSIGIGNRFWYKNYIGDYWIEEE